MILDKQNLLSDDQAITASAASENIIDLGVARDIGKGTPIPFEVQVTEDFATLTSLTVALQVDDNASFSSAKTVISSAAIAAADLVAGYKFNIGEYVPRGTDERYARLYYTVAGSNATAGAITAGVSMGSQTNK